MRNAKEGLIEPQADHRMCSWFKRIYEGYEYSSENCTSKSHLGLNIPTKLNETLIDSCMVFFRLLGPSKASYSEINFSR